MFESGLRSRWAVLRNMARHNHHYIHNKLNLSHFAIPNYHRSRRIKRGAVKALNVFVMPPSSLLMLSNWLICWLQIQPAFEAADISPPYQSARTTMR